MRLKISIPTLRVQVAGTALHFGAGWLAVLPLMLWLVATWYVPIMEPLASTGHGWRLGVPIVALLVASLLVHVGAHLAATLLLSGAERRRVEREGKNGLPVYPFGDVAKAWPAAGSPWREAIEALAGPVASGALAGIGYLLWDGKFNADHGAIVLFFMVFNGAIAVINLTPSYPFDGGRIVRAMVWGLLRSPRQADRWARWLGLGVAAVMTGWGAFLFAQHDRFSHQTAATAWAFAALVPVGIVMHRGPSLSLPPTRGGRTLDAASREARPLGIVALAARGTAVVVAVLVMMGVAFGLAPTNYGLEAPGDALRVEPMVSVPQEYRHTHPGTFLLTTVIPLTPIVAAEWVYAKVAPTVKLVPPEVVVPRGVSPRQQALRSFRELIDSTTIAEVVGLRLAGYQAEAVGTGARVLSLAPESKANGILQPQDVVKAINGSPMRTTDDVRAIVQKADVAKPLQVQVVRDGQTLSLAVPLIAGASPSDPPRVGIAMEDAGVDVRLPFPVTIRPDKISGGPSAGLMFTLTVANAVSAEDLTRGHKIAGTGTIDLDGNVGPIGGVEQKVAAAESAGAEYFLSPPQNYDDARRVAHDIKVIKVATAQEAVAFLRGLTAR
ncbi:MAG: hypothetical protein HY261_01860 [Chloroflexi bacterium]|nr:hypothetical protein [Chloroflexota bacterium]